MCGNEFLIDLPNRKLEQIIFCLDCRISYEAQLQCSRFFMPGKRQNCVAIKTNQINK